MYIYKKLLSLPPLNDDDIVHCVIQNVANINEKNCNLKKKCVKVLDRLTDQIMV